MSTATVGSVVLIPAGTTVRTEHPDRPEIVTTRSQTVKVTEVSSDGSGLVRWKGMGGYLCEAANWRLLAAPAEEVADTLAAPDGDRHEDGHGPGEFPGQRQDLARPAVTLEEHAAEQEAYHRRVFGMGSAELADVCARVPEWAENLPADLLPPIHPAD